MKFGIALGRLNPRYFTEAAVEADKLGFESLWIPEHLVLPVDMAGSPFPGAEHPPVPPSTPVFDVFGVLAFLAGKTSRIRLGTHVYLLGLRHPFVAARAIQTLDLMSEGRAEVGVGAGWLRGEWTAAGLDPATRGRRLDEALYVCKCLWTEEVIEHHGEFFDFEPVMFEPKPIQKPHPPILIGGESDSAFRRAARSANGWLGLQHTFESIAEPVAKLRKLLAESDREKEPFQIAIGAEVESRDDVKRWEDAGVTRILVSPWQRSKQAIDGLRRFADRVFG